jgi:hypothetical protein
MAVHKLEHLVIRKLFDTLFLLDGVRVDDVWNSVSEFPSQVAQLRLRRIDVAPVAAS